MPDPNSVSWQMHADPTMWIAGIASLYLQALHPKAVAGVVQNSNFQADPLGRLKRTADFVGLGVYGTDEERRDSAAALKAATGLLRTEVGRNITARITPSLEFIADAIPENAEHIEALLREARARDEEVTALASTAAYAGDADPYVKPRDVDEELVEDGEIDDEASDLADDAELGGAR